LKWHLGMDWTGVAMEGPDFPENRRIICTWYVRFPGKPAENVAVQGFEQKFVIIEFASVKVADLGIDETSKQEIHLTHAAMPGAEQNAPLPGVESQTFRLRSRHDSFLPEMIWPGGRRRKPLAAAHYSKRPAWQARPPVSRVIQRPWVAFERFCPKRTSIEARNAVGTIRKFHGHLLCRRKRVYR
jgi:hypothetical protein